MINWEVEVIVQARNDVATNQWMDKNDVSIQGNTVLQEKERHTGTCYKVDKP